MGPYSILDWWAVIIAVEGGSTPGIYQNSGATPFPHWKECQLQSRDVDQNLTFAVNASSFDINLASGGCPAAPAPRQPSTTATAKPNQRWALP
jgi:phospholipase C